MVGASGPGRPGLTRRACPAGCGPDRVRDRQRGGAQAARSSASTRRRSRRGACIGDDLSATQKEVIISNWPAYIDPRKKPTSTVSVFQDRTGITVDYTDDVNDNDEFYAKVKNQLGVVRADQPRHDDADRLDGGAR